MLCVVPLYSPAWWRWYLTLQYFLSFSYLFSNFSLQIKHIFDSHIFLAALLLITLFFFFAKLSLLRAILRIFIELFHAIFTSVYIMLMFYAFKWRNCRHWNPDEICLPTFVVDEFSGLFLHPPIFLLNIQDLHKW